MTTTGAVKSVDSVLVECDVPLVTRDGTVLRSNVYRPSGDGPWPVLLTRLPYGKDNPPALGFHASLLDPMAAARRGYIVVVQDVRGTNASDGEFRPFRDEYTDGADAVSWAAGLPGSSGVVGMYGASYFGHTQFAAAVESEEVLRALIPRLRCADPLNGMYFRHGAFELTMQVSWYLHMAVGEAVRQYAGEPEKLLEVVRELVASTDALGSDGYSARPLTRFAPLYGQPLSETFFTPLENPMDAAALDFLDFSKKMDRIQVPALHMGGWYDIFLQQTIDDFVEMRRRGVPASLFIGPGFHDAVAVDPIGDRLFGVAASDFAVDLTTSTTEIQLRWMDRWLKNEDNGAEDPAVRVFVMGENKWRTFEDWPPPATHTPWYLRPAGELALTMPASSEPDTYAYDPDNPVPTLGGAIMSDPAHRPGVFDQRPIESRPDVLTYTSEPLAEDVPVVGRITAHLWARTDAADTDFVVRLCDVRPDGRSDNITDGIVRAIYRDVPHGGEPTPLDAGKAYEYVIDMWSTANVFRAGHRIRIHVTSSNFPRWDANPNTGTPFSSAGSVIARQEILHDPQHPSHVLLPVLAGR